jgi:hypothetical protein
MNERIRELAEQAGFYVADGKIYIPSTSEEITTCQKKFAELIVRECIQVISNTDTRQSFTTYDLGLVQATMVKIQNNVKKHFKPEE